MGSEMCIRDRVKSASPSDILLCTDFHAVIQPSAWPSPVRSDILHLICASTVELVLAARRVRHGIYQLPYIQPSTTTPMFVSTSKHPLHHDDASKGHAGLPRARHGWQNSSRQEGMSPSTTTFLRGLTSMCRIRCCDCNSVMEPKEFSCHRLQQYTRHVTKMADAGKDEDEPSPARCALPNPAWNWNASHASRRWTSSGSPRPSRRMSITRYVSSLSAVFHEKAVADDVLSDLL